MANPPEVKWEAFGTAKHANGYTYYIWRTTDEDGELFQVTNNPIPPYSYSGYRSLDGLLRLKSLTKEK
jgi:hypothetical protein